jgi:5'-nucleotidase (lipoprotein e(P4) family)
MVRQVLFRRSLPAIVGVLLSAGPALAQTAAATAAVAQPVEAAAPPACPNPPATYNATHHLAADLWMQTSAEYRATCLTIYRSAEKSLAAILETGAFPKPAVVMDLDETVFDNGAYQAFQQIYDLVFCDRRWEDYEANHGDLVRLVPGAKAFIESAQKRGATVIFLSNRLEKYAAATEAALTRLGIPATVAEGRLFLKTTTSDKSLRRAEIGLRHNVVMFVGDNLRDFSELFAAGKVATAEEQKAALGRRDTAVDLAAEAHWGVDWFMLPNPTYGEWEKLLGTDPKALLHPTTQVP